MLVVVSADSAAAVRRERGWPGRGWAAAIVVLLLLSGLVASCGKGGGRRGAADVIVSEEIRRSAGLTAYDVVQQLRPHFLRVRVTRTARTAAPIEPVVYVDGLRMGGLDQLRSIRAGDVEEIRYLGAADATTRYGTGHVGGAILIRLHS